MATVAPNAGQGPPVPINVNAGPWALVSHRCMCRTKSGERCKRKTRHLSRWCWQHRAPLTDDEVAELVARRPYRCQAHTRAGRQCSRDATKRYVLPYCKQHYKITAGDDAASDSEDDL